MNNRKRRDEYRTKGNGYYHFCTDGLTIGKLFYSPEQFAYGMILIGLLTIKFNVKIYAFVLMPNHIHIILSGTGENCIKAFDYLRFKISARLKADGYDPLPEDYDFVLLDIKDQNQMKSEIVYVLRNPLEKDFSTPLGYLWGSGWIWHSTLTQYIKGEKASTLSVRKAAKLTTTNDSLPPDWEFHPALGLLPGSFVDTAMVSRLFPTAKDYTSALVKDYESYVRTARELNEEIEFADIEIKDIVNQVLQDSFNGSSLWNLSQDEKCRLAVILNDRFNLSAEQISHAIYLGIKLVRQVLSSKEYKATKTRK